MAHERTKPHKPIPSEQSKAQLIILNGTRSNAETEEELRELLKEMERSFLSSMTSAGKIEGLDEMDNFTFLDILNKEEKEVLLNKKIEEMRKKNERLMKRHKEIQDDKRHAADIGAEGPDELMPGSRRGQPQSPTERGPPQRNRGGGHGGRSGKSRGRGYSASKQRPDFHPYSPQRTDSDPSWRWPNDSTPRRVGSGRTEHSGSVNRRGGYGRRDGGNQRGGDSSRGQGSRGQMSPKSPTSPKSPSLSLFSDDENPMAQGMTITVTNSAIAASRQKKSIISEVSKPKRQNITVSLNVQGKKGEPRRIVKMTKEEKERKEWEEKRRQNIQAMEEELKAANEFEKKKTGKPPPKSYSFLDDNRRSDTGESRRHFRNWGGTSFDDAKVQVSRHRSEKKDSGPQGDMTMSMTGRERKEYADWKAERDRIDQERLQRHKRATGEWKREWDREKDRKDDDDKPASRSSNRGDRIGSGRFDNRGPRGGGKGKQRSEGKNWTSNKGENDNSGGNRDNSGGNRDNSGGNRDNSGGNRKRQQDNKKKGVKLTLDVTPNRKGGGRRQGGSGSGREAERDEPSATSEEGDSSALSPGLHASSPLSPISPGVLKTPTDHVHVNDWAAEMESGSGSSQGKSEDGAGKEGWSEDNRDEQAVEGGGDFEADVTEEVKIVDLAAEGSQDAALSETGDSFESYKSADSEVIGDDRRLSGEKSDNSQTETQDLSDKGDPVMNSQDEMEQVAKNETVEGGEAKQNESAEPEGQDGNASEPTENHETATADQAKAQEIPETSETAPSDVEISSDKSESVAQPAQDETETSAEKESVTPAEDESAAKEAKTEPTEKETQSTEEGQGQGAGEASEACEAPTEETSKEE
ncbi:coiled-coil domain-containing protein 9-like isoform X3 [Ptychodera flava]|uniref:coiled-coil domain-containing protein 9-like isoform X3 n=1 Tax=Ptychodera flava TaxID=63121 RepID=UPI00396A26DE